LLCGTLRSSFEEVEGGEEISAADDGAEISSHAPEVALCLDSVCDSLGIGYVGDGVSGCMDGGRGSVDVVGSYAV